MGKHDRARKQVNRLQLRREVLRVLTGDNLAEVHGGVGCDATITEGCRPTWRPTTGP